MAPTKRPLKDAVESKPKESRVEKELPKDEEIDEELDLVGSQENQDSTNEMSSMMNMFQTSLVQKSDLQRKRSGQFLNASVKLTTKKMEEVVQRQGTERRKLQDQYQRQVDSLINTWDGEIEKAKEMEEKLATTFRQQQKFYTTLRVNQTKILTDLKALCKQFNETNDKLETLHSSQQGDLQGDLKREVSMLHKKYLMDSHNAELAKMKKNMQQILTSSF